jgi:hypothetical protein
VAFIGAKRNTCRILVGKFKKKKTFERPRNRWNDVLKFDF